MGLTKASLVSILALAPYLPIVEQARVNNGLVNIVILTFEKDRRIMRKVIALSTALAFTALGMACGGAPTTNNANANKTIANAMNAANSAMANASNQVSNAMSQANNAMATANSAMANANHMGNGNAMNSMKSNMNTTHPMANSNANKPAH